jgi:PTH1 family peptidyl-tRNA hydrolase
VVGLGNPLPRYRVTRHNIGFRIVEAFADRHGLALNQERWLGRYGAGRAAGRDVGVLGPQTFMNSSGTSLLLALGECPEVDPARDLIVVYDDLDLAFGRIRLRASGGSGGQRGVQNIIDLLGRQDFSRLRFGLGRPSSEGEDVSDFVLRGFEPDELMALPGRISEATDVLDHFLHEGIESAMDRFNAGANPA